MTEIKRAIDLLESYDFDGSPDLTEAAYMATYALREKQEREKGCEFCLDDSCPPLDWQYGLDHILPGYRFCPMCGRPLSET